MEITEQRRKSDCKLSFVYSNLLITLSTTALTCLSIRLIGLFSEWIYTIFANSPPAPTFSRWFFVGPLTFALLAAFHVYDKVLSSRRAALLGFMLAVMLISICWAIGVVHSFVASPYEWDFSLFWLWGRAAAQGLDFYEPQHFHQLFQQISLPFTPGRYFIDAVTNIGFWYPPPTMLYFLPLGWLDFDEAYVLWVFFNSAVLVLDICLLWKLFFCEIGLIGIVMTTALVFLLPATLKTIYYGQTNFIVLLMTLLIWRDSTRLRVGIWVAIGIFTKPIMAIFLAYLMFRRRWRAIMVSIISMCIISLVTMGVFGSDIFLSYFTENPTGKVPIVHYYEEVNQSLLATVLRLTNYTNGETHPLTNPIFILFGSIFAIVTWWIVYRLNDNHTSWALALSLSLGLLLYPSTLSHYSVLLIVPLMHLYVHRQDFTGGLWRVVSFISLIYIVGYFSFVSNALTWLVLTVICISRLKGWCLQLNISSRQSSA